VAILLDGFRRVRRAGEGKLRVKRRRQPIFEGDDFDEFGSELPGGGARVVAFRDEDSAEEFSQTIKSKREYDPSRVTSPFRQSEPTAIEVVENGPSQDDPVAESEGLVENIVALESTTELDSRFEAEARAESQFSLFEGAGAAENLAETQQNPVTVAPDIDDIAENKAANKKSRKSRGTKDKQPKGRASKTTENQAPSPSLAPVPDIADDDVIILHLMAEQGEVFQGDDLLNALIANGLRYGSLKIFHRHEREDGSGDVLFSMANSVNPGTFELNTMGEFLTPGVTFMMVLADSEDPLVTFDLMLACIHGITSAIGGELKDQQRSALSQQTAEHYRQRIMDFNRRRLTASA